MSLLRAALAALLTLGMASGDGGLSPKAPAGVTASFPPPPWAIAHRGAAGLLPEHTLAAYALAVDQVCE